MSSKHILGIGQTAPGKVVIVHGNALECDHALPLATLADCPSCLKAELEAVESALMVESSL